MPPYLVYTVAVIYALSYAFGSILAKKQNSTMVHGFSELTASAELAWSPCFANFTCALLKVPLDYSNVSVGTTNLAIIKKPGATEDAQEVLVNPGGPGGSSVTVVLFDWEGHHAKIGNQYALVGIDPRGVGDSGPSSDCFPPEYPDAARNAFLGDVFQPADVTSEYALRLNHQTMRAYGEWCSARYAVNGTAKYASTVATAQDMLHYVELRAKSVGQAPEEAKLWFYGRSYGSVLGATYASLYPDRIGRMILDGVMDLEDHYNGGWEKAIVDTDEAARFFFKRCFEAGPKLCGFHQNATSWEEIEKKYWGIMLALKDHPIGIGRFPETADQSLTGSGMMPSPYVFTYQDMINGMFVVSYLLSPATWVFMDAALQELQVGKNDLLAVVSIKAQITWPSTDDRMSRTLVNCLDGNSRANYTEFEDYERFINSLCDTSIYGCLNIAYLNGPVCSHLMVSPPESQTFDGIPRVSSTSAPILFVSTLHDPVTPFPAARKMQSLFPGSGLLALNNSGHCAYFQESKCIAQYQTQYMLDGTLPPANTTCEADEPNPFILSAKQDAARAQTV